MTHDEYRDRCFETYGALGWWVAWTGNVETADPKAVLYWKQRPEHLPTPGFALGMASRSDRRNVALVLGRSRVLAIDCDTNRGPSMLLEMLDGELPITVTTMTPRGFHILYRLPDDAPVEKFELSADGRVTASATGVVLLPPSHRTDLPGVPTYTFAVAPWDEDLAELPAVAYERLLRLSGWRAPSARPVRPARVALNGAPGTRYGVAALRGILTEMEAQTAGHRHCTLFSSARRLGKLVAAGHVDEAEARSRLRVAAVQAWGGEHAGREIDRTLRDGFEVGMMGDA